MDWSEIDRFATIDDHKMLMLNIPRVRAGSHVTMRFWVTRYDSGYKSTSAIAWSFRPEVFEDEDEKKKLKSGVSARNLSRSKTRPVAVRRPLYQKNRRDINRNSKPFEKGDIMKKMINLKIEPYFRLSNGMTLTIGADMDLLNDDILKFPEVIKALEKGEIRIEDETAPPDGNEAHK